MEIGLWGILFLGAIVCCVVYRDKRIMKKTQQEDPYSAPIYRKIENVIYYIGILLAVGVGAYTVYLSYFYFDQVRSTITNDEVAILVSSPYLLMQQPFLYSCLIATGTSIYSIFTPTKNAMLIASIALISAWIAYPATAGDVLIPAAIAFISYLCMKIK